MIIYKNKIFILFFFLLLSCNIKKDKFRGSIEGSYEIECISHYNSKDTLLTAQIEGYVIDARTKDKLKKIYLIECYVSYNGKRPVIKTNELGYFSLKLPVGTYKFKFFRVGKTPLITDEIHLKKNTSSKILVKLGTVWII